MLAGVSFHFRLPPPGIKEDIYTTTEGDFVLRWPENASEESVEGFEVCMNLDSPQD